MSYKNILEYVIGLDFCENQSLPLQIITKAVVLQLQ